MLLRRLCSGIRPILCKNNTNAKISICRGITTGDSSTSEKEMIPLKTGQRYGFAGKPLKTDFTDITQDEADKWTPWGVHEDMVKDETNKHIFMFFTFTISMVCLSFYWYHGPDNLLNDWVQREAYLKMRDRRALGHHLDIIDPNYVPIERIRLPSEEELGDFTIIC